MSDVVGNKDGVNEMRLSYERVTPAIANSTGSYLGINKVSTMESFPVCWNYTGAAVSHLSLPALPSIGARAATVAARTNPSRAHVQVPVIFSELREIPGLVRRFGNDAFKNIGDANLRVQFGIKPMLSDLRRLANFQAVVEKRLRELESLRKNGGLRRRVTLSHDIAVDTPTVELLQSSPHSIYGSRSRVTERDVWGSARWKPNAIISGLDPDEIAALVRRTLLGLTVSQITQNLWDALPWSWLIDWFANIGDLLAGMNNSIGHLAGDVCIMTHTRTTSTTRCFAYGSNSVAQVKWLQRNHVVEKGVKERKLASPSFSASVPILTGRQLSILGSLVATRRRG